MKDLEGFELGWVVGIFEGEGCFLERKPHHGHYKSGYSYPRIAVNMTDEDTILRLKSVIAGGCICGPYRQGNKKPFWIWSIDGDNAIHLMKMVLPHMSKRRQERINDIILLCETSRELAKENLRKTTRKTHTGRKRGPETVRKLSIANKAVWTRKKEIYKEEYHAKYREAYLLRRLGLSWAKVGEELGLSGTGARQRVLNFGPDPLDHNPKGGRYKAS